MQEQKQSDTELILIRITGEDRPGLTASVMEILAKYDATIMDIGQADIHSTLSLGILCQTKEAHSGFIMKELLFAASSLGLEAMPKIQQAEKVGELIAKKAIEAGVTAVVFDRNGYLYHGRVKELADAARKGGLNF